MMVPKIAVTHFLGSPILSVATKITKPSTAPVSVTVQLVIALRLLILFLFNLPCMLCSPRVHLSRQKRYVIQTQRGLLAPLSWQSSYRKTSILLREELSES